MEKQGILIVIPIILLLCGCSPQPSQQKSTVEKPEAGSLCKSEEVTVLTFKISDSPKQVAVCTSNHPSYLVYRFGQPDQIELQYPENLSRSWEAFTYSDYVRGGDVQNEGMELHHLTFENHGYTYQVYEEYIARDNSKKIGIRVTEPSTQKRTDMAGDFSTKTGNLITLKDGPVPKVEE